MNPSCLVFAFQFSVTDFKSQRRQVQGGLFEHRSNNRAEIRVQGRRQQALQQREADYNRGGR